jgi:sterol desaturase/sphingolipid hydroxylase (fatty acid hydroxylase superfamily)
VWSELVELVRVETADFTTLQLRAFGMFFGLCALEGLLTGRRSAKPPPELVSDMFYWLLSPLMRVVSRVTTVLVLVAFALLLRREVGPGLFDGFGPLARQPLWLATIELLLLMDLVSYWSHRLFHTVPFLWRFHAIHHSAKFVRWATTARVHPVNELVTYLVTTVPFFLLGFPLKAIFPLLPWVMAFALLAHVQWNLSYGWLGRVFVSPLYHRWHHTHSNEGGNSNFSNVFAFWDRLFGTHYFPAGRLPEKLGLDVDELEESYWKQLAYPFRPRERALPGAAEPVVLTASSSPARSLAPATPPPGPR